MLCLQDLALNEPQGSPEERQAWRRAQARRLCEGPDGDDWFGLQ